MTAPIWPQLMTAALLGTGRRPAQVSGASPLGDLVTAERVASGEAGLLEAAAAITVARRAGVAASTGVTPVDAAPADDRPQVGEAAAARLARLLGGSADMSLIRLWLSLAARRDLRAPTRHLPALFGIARHDEAVRPMVVTVAGVRGAWLAAQRREWAWVVDARAAAETPDDPEVWLEGQPAERVAYLAKLRHRDADAARDLLAESWTTERPEERAAMLATLADRLGPADEPFIEAALDDRRKEVRTGAADLLARLTGSAYQQRMTQRALACVKSPRSGRLVVTPPSDCDASMKRDGIESKPPRGIGPRGWWLEQVAMRAPASAWAGLGSPAELAGAKANDDWAPTLRRGWARAAVVARDPVWATALVEAGYGRGDRTDVADTVLATSLYELLPPAAAEALVLHMITGKGTPTVTELGQALSGCARPWSPELAGVLLRFLKKYALETRHGYLAGRLSDLRDTVAEGLDVRMRDEVRAMAGSVRAKTDEPFQHEILDTLADTVSVRFQIHQEFE
ncbi:MAG TPA: DUF5691 domain-containing protein [Micromonosporaceae bacterium]|nr:DUF5691 domain-containing protein [Micromonosporaceae bacterium]